jgi:hypothetical protein
MSTRGIYPFPFACTDTAPGGKRPTGEQWPAGTEPALADVLDDPLVHLVMRRDGVTPQALDQAIARARATLGLTRPPCRARGTAKPVPVVMQHGRR